MNKTSAHIQILSAVYGTDKVGIDVTEKIASLVTNGSFFCDGEYNQLFGDPMKGKRKTLSVLLIQDGVRCSVTRQEREPLTLPLQDLMGVNSVLSESGDWRGKSTKRVGRSTLDYILGKFNLDPKADYSKVSLPIGLRMNRRQLAELFRDLGFKIGVEIGTAGGEYAETLCKSNPEGKLICVDAWLTYDGYKDYRRQGTLDDLYTAARARLEPYNAEFLRMFSVEAAGRFEDESLDFAYIDASHRYDHVLADIAAWLPKLKPGSILAGHDYGHPKGKDFGVVEAVQYWTRTYSVAPWFIHKGEWEADGDRTHSWFWIKE